MRIFSPSLVASIVFTLAFAAWSQVHAGMVYLALGDSNAFGVDDSTPASTMPSHGDQGYVGRFGDFLGSLNGGVRPTVVNLAIPGELASSFLTAVTPTGYSGRASQLNLNYPNAATSQNSLMLAALDAAHAAGSSVYTSFNIGTNDVRLLVSSAAFQAATPAQQQALFANLLNQVSATYQTVLTEIAAHAPGTHVLLPGFFNGLLPSEPGYAPIEMATLAADQAVQRIANAFGATYVDFYSIIHGHETQLVNPTGAAHLNQAGYAAVALALDAAAVPEPSSLLMLGLGVIVLTVPRRRGKGGKRAGTVTDQS